MTPEEYLQLTDRKLDPNISPTEFMNMILERVKRGYRKERKLGYIDPLWTSGRPRVHLDGEDVVSDKEYPYFSPKDWVAGDRVGLELYGDTWIVVGKVV